MLGKGKTRQMTWGAPKGPARKHMDVVLPLPCQLLRGREDLWGDMKPAPAPVPPEPLMLLTFQRQLQQDMGTLASTQLLQEAHGSTVRESPCSLLPQQEGTGQRASPLQAPA